MRCGRHAEPFADPIGDAVSERVRVEGRLRVNGRLEGVVAVRLDGQQREFEAVARLEHHPEKIRQQARSRRVQMHRQRRTHTHGHRLHWEAERKDKTREAHAATAVGDRTLRVDEQWLVARLSGGVG